MKNKLSKRLYCTFNCLLPVFGLLFISLSVQSKNYYFSSTTGNDTYSAVQAQNSATPWRSIAKLNAIFSTLVAGDSILFKRGEVFYGAIITGKSGTSSSPIVISAYGTGAKPLISGFTKLSVWNLLGNGVYQSALPGGGNELNMVTLNDQPQALGRYPNTNDANGGYLKYESFADTTSITDNELTAAINWTGAEVIIRKKLWVLDRCRVINHSGSTLTYINHEFSEYPGTRNFGYFIQNDPRTLDQLGEWYFNNNSKNLNMYFGTANPSSYNIRASTVDTLLLISSTSYITVNNIAFEGANGVSIYLNNTSNIKIQHCDISNAGESGITSQNTADILIENCTTNNILSNAFKLYNIYVSNNTVRNCTVKNTGLLPGMGLSGGNSYKGILASVLNNLVIEYNRVDSSGFVGIEFQGSNVSVNNNVVNYFCFQKEDGGGIYTWTGSSDFNPGVNYTNRVIRDNIIMNGIGAPASRFTSSIDVSGIHLDGRSVNIDVFNNTVFDIRKDGIHTNNPVNVNIKGNTFFNNDGVNVGVMRWANIGQISNLVIKNNINYPKTSTQKNFVYINSALNEPAVTTVQSAVQALGDIDSNYYNVVNAAGFTYDIYATSGGAAIPVSKQALDGWKAFSQQDANSKKPFREAPQYKLANVTGANLFANGSFATNILGVILFGANLTGSWDNTGKITGAGSLRMNFTSPLANKWGTIHAPIGPVTANKNYVFRFTTLGTTAYGIVNAYLRKTAAAYTSLVPLETRSFGTGTVNHEFLFAAPTTDAAASFVIEIEQNSGTTYIDNIELYEADATSYNIDDYLRFEYNPTNIAKTVALGANYIGVDAAYFPGTITLQPYTSKILLKDTSILRQPLAAKSVATAINCFGGTSTITVSATGGIPPYSGPGTFVVPAGTHTYTVSDLTGAASTTTITVTQPLAALRAVATPGIISFFGGTTTVNVTATGGTAPYTGTGSFLNIIAGTYTYTVRDSRGCTASTTITIGQPLVLRAAASAVAINCFGGTTTVTVTATGGILPYTGTGSFVVSAGTFSYTVRDAVGVTNTISLTVTQPSAALVATLVAGTISVFGGTTTLSILASGGTAPYTGTGTINNVRAGSYTYMVTDSKGCTSTTTVNIPQPSPDLIAAATSPVINCFGTTANVNITATGGAAPYTGTGTYTVGAGKGSVKISFVSAASGNNTALYFTIGAVSVTKNYVLRFSTLGTTENGSLRASIRQTFNPWALRTAWQTATFGTDQKDHEFIFTAPASDAAASFIIDINQNSGTTYVDNIAFFEAGNANTLKGDNLYSNGDFESGVINLLVNNANGNQIFSWDTSSKTNAVHYFTIKDANNSTGTAIVKTNQPGLLEVTATPGTISVYGGATSVAVSATGGTAPYTGTGTRTNVAAGTYTYTVTDGRGCSASTTVTITQPVPPPFLPVTTTATIDCFGKSTVANVTASGGIAPYTGAGNYTVDAGKGSLRMSFPAVISGSYSAVYFTIGEVSSLKNYVLRFSTFGTTANGSLRACVRQTFTPWALLTPLQTATFGAGRKDHEFVFTSPTSGAAASFVIFINQNSGTTYIDNIAFFEADDSYKLKGANLYANGSFESGISNILIVSTNGNHTAAWDTSSKVTGTYYYVINDASGNSVTSVVNSTQPVAPLQVNAVATGTINITGGNTQVLVSAIGGTAPYTGTGNVANVTVGTYTYTVTDAKGCAASRTIAITQTAARPSAPASTSISVTPGPGFTSKPFSIAAYPNPANNNFGLVVEGGTNERVMVVVSTVDGKAVYSASGNSNQQYHFGSGFPTGLYILKVTQGNMVKTLKLVKIK